MKTVKKYLAGFLGFFLIAWVFAVGAAAAAENNLQNVQPGQKVQQPQEQQVKPNMQSRVGYDPFFGLTHTLNMSKTQKAQVARVLKSNEDQAKTIAREMANAIVQVRKDFVEGKFNNAHFEDLVKFERQSSELKAQIMSSILPKLTMEQRTTLAGMQDKLGSKINSNIDSKFAELDTWISKNINAS